jgi:hypothetical protein
MPHLHALLQLAQGNFVDALRELVISNNLLLARTQRGFNQRRYQPCAVLAQSTLHGYTRAGNLAK